MGQAEAGPLAEPEAAKVLVQSRGIPSRWAILIVPTLDDLARMSVTVMRWPRVRVVVGVVGDLQRGGHVDDSVSGVTRPSSSAAARVITLLTEPGS